VVGALVDRLTVLGALGVNVGPARGRRLGEQSSLEDRWCRGRICQVAACAGRRTGSTRIRPLVADNARGLWPVCGAGRSVPHGAVDAFPDQVGVTVVPRVLLDHVLVHPAQ
jgi:hypothetical protein